MPDDILFCLIIKLCLLLIHHCFLGSGLPVANGDRHANEVVTLATRLVAAIRTFKIPKLSALKISIRVGIHTGNAIGGIVYRIGTPSYAVVGEAITYDREMEREGLPNAIHVTKRTISLINHSDFDITSRVSFKFRIEKQFCKTYWITEK